MTVLCNFWEMRIDRRPPGKPVSSKSADATEPTNLQDSACSKQAVLALIHRHTLAAIISNITTRLTQSWLSFSLAGRWKHSACSTFKLHAANQCQHMGKTLYRSNIGPLCVFCVSLCEAKFLQITHLLTEALCFVLCVNPWFISSGAFGASLKQ